MKKISVLPLVVFGCLAVVSSSSAQLQGSLTNGLAARYTFSGNATNTFGPGSNAIPAGDFAYLPGGGIRITGDLGHHSSLGGGFVELPVASWGITNEFTFHLVVNDVSQAKWWGGYLLFWGIDGPGKRVVWVDAKPTNNWAYGAVGPRSPEYVSFGSSANHWQTNIPALTASIPSSFFTPRRSITLVKSPTNISLYLDGVLKGASANTQALPAEPSMHIGKHTWTESGGGTSTQLSASIYEMLAYNRALTPSEISQLHQGAVDSDQDGVNNYREDQDGTDPNDPNSFNPLSKGLVAYFPFRNSLSDESGNALSGANNGCTFTTNHLGQTNSAIAFAGSQHARLKGLGSVLSGKSEISIAGWYYLESGKSHPLGYSSGFIEETSSGENVSPALRISVSGDPYNFIGGNMGLWKDVSTSAKFPMGQWAHITAVLKVGSLPTMYLNGIPLTWMEPWLPDVWEQTISFNSDYGIGADITDGEAHWGTFSIGAVSELRFYDRALSPAEIAQLSAADSDGDGLIDAVEMLLQPMGFDPFVNNSAQVAGLFLNPNNAFLFTRDQYETFGASRFSNGQTSVTTNPSAFNLFTLAQYNANRTNGRRDVTTNPSAFNLFTQKQFNSNRTAGRKDVTANPSAFNLYTRAEYRSFGRLQFSNGQTAIMTKPSAFGLLSRTDIPPINITAPKRTAFKVNVEGSWDRYAQSGAPKGWSFDTKTGALSGSIPLKGERTVRVVPYKGSEAGPPMIIKLQPTP